MDPYSDSEGRKISAGGRTPKVCRIRELSVEKLRDTIFSPIRPPERILMHLFL